jgi:hypothetical protein
MGAHKIFIEAVGNHGCDRQAKEGEERKFCGEPGCADCVGRNAVAALQKAGFTIREAKLSHWPDDHGGAAVVDDLATGRRVAGDFLPKG